MTRSSLLYHLLKEISDGLFSYRSVGAVSDLNLVNRLVDLLLSHLLLGPFGQGIEELYLLFHKVVVYVSSHEIGIDGFFIHYIAELLILIVDL